MSPVEDEGKPWAKSRTLWTNLTAIVLGAVMEALNLLVAHGVLPEGGWMLMILGAIGIVLRTLTREPIKK